ncbi:MAG: NAD(P)H-hydrate dehydratase [Deltaproteobacteria bacterium]|uniref:Bifunctional NAD(P)H-hydrate repair enzyme n=1 Tax=Candidatus Zymogenus saltonus TaxID=2844893 RepID=A0A9D8PQ11_9DELT|nr:NAD(P)H-hydrate dehydratase [Candidatus Zymogenus saltonus]
MKVATAEIIRELDRRAMAEFGISGAVLMENAGLGVAGLFLEKFPEVRETGAVIACGRGNNGGDGFVIARHLANRGVSVDVFIAGEAEKVREGESKTNLDILKKMGIGVAEVKRDEDLLPFAESIKERGFVVDAMLGTGLDREVGGIYARMITAVNDIVDASSRMPKGHRKKVVAVDIPSGIDSDTGRVMGVAVKADSTFALALPKLGEIIYPGAEYAGELYVLDISIPKRLVERMEIDTSLVTPGEFFSLTAKRNPQAHKGDFGHLLIVAGSPGKTGAAALAAEGALLSGAGLVTVGVPASLNDVMEVKTTAAMTEPLPDDGGYLTPKALDRVLDLAGDGSSVNALALGPGLGTKGGIADVVRGLVLESNLPLVIDADGLNAVAGDCSVLKKRKADIIITPHPGEMGRLIGKRSAELQVDRVGAASGFALEYGIWVVLKGARTIVAAPDGELFIATCGNPGMARGGVGDILTGLIGGFLAVGENPKKAALAGVYVHGMAGDSAAERVGEVSLGTADILEEIPGITAALYNGEALESDGIDGFSARGMYRV